MNHVKYADGTELIYLASGAKKISSVPPALVSRPLSNRVIGTGHSIMDALKGALADAIEAMGGDPANFFGTEPGSQAGYRWSDDPAGPYKVRELLEEEGASYADFLGMEAGYYYAGSYRTTVQEMIVWADAFGAALTWHNAAAAVCERTWYISYWTNDPPVLFDADWRAAQDAEAALRYSIIEHVNDNRNEGTPAMGSIPLTEVFSEIWDAIDSGDVTGVAMVDFFADDIHPKLGYGIWAIVTTVLLVVFRIDPSEVPANAGINANIDPDVAAQLRPVIRAACLAALGTGLV